MDLQKILENALSARECFLNAKHLSAFRLFNGFSEGNPALVIDIYARTAIIHNYADIPSDGEPDVCAAQAWIRDKLDWIQCIVVKTRNGITAKEKNGLIVHGMTPDQRVQEHGIWYAIDILMNRDASLYLDTRNLRQWAIENLKGKIVLNTFAYTGSLGVAALAGCAARVVHLDRNRAFLNLAKTSYTLNGFPIAKKDFLAADFFPVVSQFKRAGETFDCVFLDPPFFATTPKGTVDLENDSARLINKVRPLINNGGTLVAINNALFVSGREYIQTLESLCADGYLEIEKLIPVPDDFTGYPQTRADNPGEPSRTVPVSFRKGNPPVDPSPFNHSTKITILRVRRKKEKS